MTIRDRTASLWPRRAPGLPPGQRRLDGFPRFSDKPLRPPPPVPRERAILEIGGDDVESFTVSEAELTAVGSHDQTSDFHCVTTWTRQDARWTGVTMADVWERIIAPRLDQAPGHVVPSHAVAIGLDGHRAVFSLQDLIGPEVMLATGLDGDRLDARHGAPLRLVSPAQYGYKSVKHLCALELHGTEPKSTMGPKEHLRARVALEERHSRIPAGALRLPYRLVVPLTIVLAERADRRPSGD